MAYYLTIDDAPSDATSDKLDFLNQHGIKAVWFCRGKGLEEYPDAGLQIIKTGHILANHSYDHPYFSQISTTAAKEQVNKTDKLIQEIYRNSGVSTYRKFFRFPYGDKGDKKEENPSDQTLVWHREEIISYLQQLNYQSGPFSNAQYLNPYIANKSDDPFWGWSYDVQEWKLIKAKRSYKGIKKDLNLFLEHHKKDKDQIILIHDHSETTRYFYELLLTFMNTDIKFILP